LNLSTSIALKTLLRWLIEEPIHTLQGERQVTADEAKQAAAVLARSARGNGQGIPSAETVLTKWKRT
jgi:hypothetical protein